MKRLIFMMLGVAGCGASDTSTSAGPQFLPVPTGSAVYLGNLAKTTTSFGSANGVSYTEVQTLTGSISLNANFDTGQLTASVSNPSSDFARSSTQSNAATYNFVEEATFSGTVSGIGTLTGTGFNSAVAGNLIQVSDDRSPVTGAASQAFAGTVSGQIEGSAFDRATGTVSLGRPLSGQTVPLFSDLGFRAARN